MKIHAPGEADRGFARFALNGIRVKYIYYMDQICTCWSKLFYIADKCESRTSERNIKRGIFVQNDEKVSAWLISD